MSAILLPFQTNGEIDWLGFHQHVERTRDAGLTPAINMDTGYGPLIDPPTRHKALSIANDIMAGEPFIAGAFVPDQPGDCFQRKNTFVEPMRSPRSPEHPFCFNRMVWHIKRLRRLLRTTVRLLNRAIDFMRSNLGTMFAPFGKIYTLDLFRELVKIPECVGLKHSSLSRELEWQRLDVRDELRPEFQLLTGNDLAIDMVMYGSDYLLGLSTFCLKFSQNEISIGRMAILRFTNSTIRYSISANLPFAIQRPLTNMTQRCSFICKER
ncbi:MAG: hypothetical protein R3C03_23785 [Pirellulaceae bacterium]